MLPDFQGLRQQSGNSTDLRSLKPRSGEPFDTSQSFQKFDKDRDRTSDHTAFSEIDHRFLQLWIEQPSWSPILLTDHGWITVKGKGKKQVPLTFSTLESYYRRGHIIGKRFGKLTNYLMLDIDINSPFHPQNSGFNSILTTMEHLGLCRYLLVRSSTSGGLHLYFPLPEPVNAWQLASTAHNALTASGIPILGGQCELFPNKKAFNAEHNGHRLPLQNGSFLLDEDCSPISNHKADFLRRWQTAAAHQDEKTLQLALTGQIAFAPPSIPVELPLVATPTTRTHHVIPPIAWTRFGQSNDIMRELVNYGDRYAGHKNSTDLAAWIKAVAPQLPGYQKFASPKSKHDIEYGTWPKRWSESHFNSAYAYKVGGSDHNANVARDAKSRIFAALDRMCVDASIGITKLFEYITSITKSCFDKHVSWHTFKKYENEIWAYIKRPGALGLSSSSQEEVDSFSAESLDTKVIEPEKPKRNHYTQLLTLKCAVHIYSSAFASLHTSKDEPDLHDESASVETALIGTVQRKENNDGKAEAVQKRLTVGQLVRIVMPGGSLDGLETRVLEQALNVLGQPVYQLDYQRNGQTISLPAECLQGVQKDKALPGDGMVKATAAQLLRVLGKACPFVGPGHWEIRPGDVSKREWRALRQLTGQA